MESGCSFQFPRFEGKFEHNNNKQIEFCSKLPKFPDIEKIYTVYETQLDALKSADGWRWGPSNKSSKTFFGNIKDVQRSLKYKCSINGCLAVKFVESEFKFEVSRIYYENHHQHVNKIDSNKLVIRRSELKEKDDGHNEEKGILEKRNKLKRRLPTKFTENRINSKAKRVFIDETSDESETESGFNPKSTSTPVPKENAETAQESIIRKNGKLKDVLEAKDLSLGELLKENLDLKLKIKMNNAHMRMMISEKGRLSQELLKQIKDVQKLKSETVILENSLNLGVIEIHTIKAKNDSLKQQQPKRGIHTLDDQIAVLENLIAEKKNDKGVESEEIRILQQSLEICSEKKKEEEEASNSQAFIDERRNVSKNLLTSFNTTFTISDSKDVEASSQQGDPSSSHNPPLIADVSPPPQQCLLEEFVTDDRCQVSPPPQKCLLEVFGYDDRRHVSPPLQKCLLEEFGSDDRRHVSPPPQECLLKVSGYDDRRHVSPPPVEGLLEDPQSDTCHQLSNPPGHGDALAKPSHGSSLHQGITSVPRAYVVGLPDQSPASSHQDIPFLRSEEAQTNPEFIEQAQIEENDTPQIPSCASESCSTSCEVTFNGNQANFKKSDFHVNDTLVQDISVNETNINKNYALDSSITFLNDPPPVVDSNLEKFDDVVNKEKALDDGKNFGISFKVSDELWNECNPITGAVPHGHNGKAVFIIDITEEQKSVKVSCMEEINDGRNWTKKKLAIKKFDGCDERKRWYQDCNGYFECENTSCSARKLFSKPTQSLVKDKNKSVVNKCRACDQKMTYFQCKDYTIKDRKGQSPHARRYLDIDYCHSKITIKYVGTHTCRTAPKVLPMDVEYIQKYFKDNPSSTASRFKDFVIANAISEGKDIEEVSFQYADLNKIRQIMMKTKRLVDPDGSGLVFLKRFAESLKDQLGDEYLLTITENPQMFIISSLERIKVAALMSDPTIITNESCSIDFCESQFKEYREGFNKNFKNKMAFSIRGVQQKFHLFFMKCSEWTNS